MSELPMGRIADLLSRINERAEAEQANIEHTLTTAFGHELYQQKLMQLGELIACYGPQTITIKYLNEHGLHMNLPLAPSKNHVEGTTAYKDFVSALHDVGFTAISLQSVGAASITIEVGGVLVSSLEEPSADNPDPVRSHVAYAVAMRERAAKSLLTAAFNSVSDDAIVDAVSASKYAGPQRLYAHIPTQRSESEKGIRVDKLALDFITSCQGLDELKEKLRHLGVYKLDVEAWTSNVIGLRIETTAPHLLWR